MHPEDTPDPVGAALSDEDQDPRVRVGSERAEWCQDLSGEVHAESDTGAD